MQLGAQADRASCVFQACADTDPRANKGCHRCIIVHDPDAKPHANAANTNAAYFGYKLCVFASINIHMAASIHNDILSHKSAGTSG